ncbi:hypothetical protein A5779_15495 [Mycolicibacterium peregrinum]|uniref:Uncharacterized protein n=1 Tax=Mycolicibacterium peregrinum TaxID=43304 RepID=A0A1A0WFQ9_MYCPR|nr:hypothetical protein A5779_15495 [Mycolicibacterium peregrinum]
MVSVPVRDVFRGLYRRVHTSPNVGDDAGWPADLPQGAAELVFVDDTPSPNAAVRVCTRDESRAAVAAFDQLAIGDHPTPR